MADTPLSAEATRQLAPEELIDVLKDCVREVFVSMLFSFEGGDACVPDGEAVAPALPTDPSSFDCGIEVEFSGAVSGSVVLRAGREAAEEITRSMLMMEPDEELEDDDVADALGECVNLVAGTLKTRALDPLGTFQLAVPAPLSPASINPSLGERDVASGRRQVYRLSQCSFSMEIWTDAVSAEEA